MTFKQNLPWLDTVSLCGTITLYFCSYHIRKRGLYKVTGLVGGFDEPMTDKFFEFGHDNKEGVVKENPGYEEKEL